MPSPLRSLPTLHSLSLLQPLWPPFWSLKLSKLVSLLKLDSSPCTCCCLCLEHPSSHPLIFQVSDDMLPPPGGPQPSLFSSPGLRFPNVTWHHL